MGWVGLDAMLGRLAQNADGVNTFKEGIDHYDVDTNFNPFIIGRA